MNGNEPEKNDVCLELYWLTQLINYSKQELREMQDKKMIIDEDYAKMMEALERADNTVWQLKKKYGCIR